MIPDIHLDLGCGARPRNPYGRSKLCGVDVRPVTCDPGVEIRIANLSVAPIPYPDDHFGSVSAFDFVEHVPRILPTPDCKDTFYPFIGLMNEVWRVLAPGGRFYALTPTYPKGSAFQDPTHVNFITARTHEYFCGESPSAEAYGFRGRFDALRAEWVRDGDSERAGPRTLRQGLRRLQGRLNGTLVYFLWELAARK